VLVGSKIGYLEQTLEPTLVTRNKPGSQNWLPGTNPGAKIGYTEQIWEPKMVTWNKPGSQKWLPGTPGSQKWLPGTNLGAKIGYPEQTWEPKLVTRKVSGKCQESLLKVSGGCLEGVQIPGVPRKSLPFLNRPISGS